MKAAGLLATRVPRPPVGACAGWPLEAFYPSERSAVAPEVVALCAGCPVLAECRDFIDRAEADTPPSALHGYVAGMSPGERAEARREAQVGPGAT